MHSIFIPIPQGRSQIALKFTLWADGSSALMEKEDQSHQLPCPFCPQDPEDPPWPLAYSRPLRLTWLNLCPDRIAAARLTQAQALHR